MYRCRLTIGRADISCQQDGSQPVLGCHLGIPLEILFDEGSRLPAAEVLERRHIGDYAASDVLDIFNGLIVVASGEELGGV